MSSHFSSSPLTSHSSSSLRGECTVPGDKSISHRALMLSSQAIGRSRIYGLLEGEDVLATAAALRAMGVSVTRLADGTWEIYGVGVGGLHEPDSVLDMGNSGTSARLLMGLRATLPGVAFFTGDASLRKRPMQRVITPLSQMGAQITSRDGGRLPLAITGARNSRAISYSMPVASAQVKSSILLAGLNAPGVTTVVERDATRDHTERMLRAMGASLSVTHAPDGATQIELASYPELSPMDWHVPGDPSSAAFLVVAATLVPESQLVIRNVGMNALRTGLFTTLIEMGAAITLHNQREEGGEEVADLTVESRPLKAVHVPAHRAPSMIDEYPILAVAAAHATGVTRMEGLSELTVKESNRLTAILDNLSACGVRARAGADWLEVEGAPGAVPGGARVITHMDHRIAMSFLVLGLISRAPITVDDSSMIATSFPGFTDLMRNVGASFSV